MSYLSELVEAAVTAARADPSRPKPAPCNCGKVAPDAPDVWGGVKAKAAAFKGQIVMLVPVRNEGAQVVSTIRAFRAKKAPGTDLHFHVVDDASNDGCCNMLGPAKDVTWQRHAEPQGQGVARNLGVLMHPGARSYVSIDAHMTMETPHGLERLALDAEETGGIVGCLSAALGNGNNFKGAGSRWHAVDTGGVMDFSPNWNYARKPVARPEDRFVDVQLHSGQCYAMTEATYHRLGAFHETFGYYGWFERDISINAYFQRIPLLVDASVQSWHLYRGPRPYTQSGRWRWWGYVQCLRAMFRPEVWREVFMPRAIEANKNLRDPMLDFLIRDPHLDWIQRDFEPRKQRTDEEVLQWLGILKTA